MGIRPIRKPIFRDQLLERGVVAALIDARVGVPADEEELEDEHREAEAVVVGGADEVTQGAALEFGRGVVGDADFAKVVLAVGADLERVAVDEPDEGLRRDEDVALVDVADEAAGGVDFVERGGAVQRGSDLEVPACAREV